MRIKPLIAVVDDEPLFRTWVSEHLEASGYEVKRFPTWCSSTCVCPT